MLPPPGFRDLNLCGTGATSQVYRAIDVRTGHVVALKRLHRQLADSAEALARLKRELEALARLRHPAIVPVRDVIRWQGAPTVVMDFIDGRDLKEMIREQGALPVVQIEGIAHALFGALSAAHAAGIVHRDVKPQNVRITGDGRVYLLDFGSARLEAGSQLTKNGTTLGTPDYMPAELFAGTAYDPRVDIYGAGATLFECITGRIHQTADSLAELAFKRTNEDPPRVRELSSSAPEHLAQVIDRCLARDPNDRYATAALAIWALDHPHEERAFAMRLATRPPCLHCGAPIARESEACSACSSDHPFSYAPGWTHVVLRGVRDPGRLFLELNARLPEWKSEEHARAVAERCAAVERQRQRLLSFVDRDEAEKLAKELEAAGAQCELVEDDGASRSAVRWAGSLVFAGALAIGHTMLSSIFGEAELGWRWLPLGILAVLMMVLLAYVDRLLALRTAKQGLFASAAPPVYPNAPLYFGTAAIVTYSLGLAAPGIGYALLEEGSVLANVAGSIMQLRPILWWAASALAAIGVASSCFRLSAVKRRSSPEPRFDQQLARAFQTPLDRRNQNGRLGALAMIVVLALVPAELFALKQIRTIDNPALWYAARRMIDEWSPTAYDADQDLVDSVETTSGPMSTLQTDLRLPEPRARRIPNRRIPDILGLDRDVGPDPLDLEAAQRAANTSELATAPQDARTGIALGWEHLALALSTLSAVALFARKKRRLTRSANELLAGIDLSRTTRARPPLARRSGGDLRAADRLARTSWNDSFVGHSKRRAVELVHCLDHRDAARATRALEDAADSDRARVDRSFLARCILETDSELKLRFALLALEGELEARAAEAWARSIAEDRA